jgi:hypothetical protein
VKASLLHRIAAYFDFEGRQGDTEEPNIKAVRIRRELFGGNDPSTLTSMANLAVIFLKQGR